MRLLTVFLLVANVLRAQVVGFPPPPASASTGYDSRVVSWATRVVTNGGAAPSTATKDALNTFVLAMDSYGLWSKMIAINFVAPDSLIACMTPLLVGPGSDPWVNSGFVSGNLSVNGLSGLGATNHVSTGINPSTAFTSTNDAGMSVYMYSAGLNNPGIVLGCSDSSGALRDIELSPGLFDCWDTSSTRTYGMFTSGFFSGSRTATNLSTLYYGNQSVATSVLSSNAVNNSGLNGLSTVIGFMADNNGGTSWINNSGGTCSFAAIHHGLSAVDTSNLCTCVVNLRSSLGGGLNTPGDDWSQRVVLNGGSAAGSTSISAINSFAYGVIADTIAGKLLALNCLAPDSLIACQTPLLIGHGYVLWTNHNFVSGDVSANGLTGNGSSKYLDTGLNPTADSQSFMCMFVYCYNRTLTGFNFGAFDTKDMYIAAQNSDGKSYLSCGAPRATGGVSLTSPGNGFFQIQRTATAVNTAYFASSVSPFAQLGSTDTVSSTGYPNENLYLMALQNSVHAAANFSSDTLSLAGTGIGMTSAEAQALYNRAQALRVAIGGGSR